eukprot:TRINITY_DN785_c1_g4_i1.p1 TRINITY_DN785_c1_g4~~TRINITY_DN785_c1_g4_i1.p1  ORF type:complete len:277 (-),score=128.19 TRINITY_DN785_c1_g4_i1:22-852(-)
MSLLPVDAIAQIEQNDSNFTKLDISNSSIWKISPDETAKDLANALKNNNTLTHLVLSGNDISDPGCAAICEVLATNNTLTHVDLSNNKIKDEGLKEVAKALKTNKSILEFNLIGQVGEPGEDALTCFIDSFEYNTTLIKIIWRLHSRQSFKITSCLTRNEEIARRLKLGKSVDDIDPNIRRETAARILAERAQGLPKFVAPEVEERTEPYEATGGPYPLEVLQAKAELLPSDVDPMKREEFLSDDEFQEHFKVPKQEFAKSPLWKRKKQKKDLQLF